MDALPHIAGRWTVDRHRYDQPGATSGRVITSHLRWPGAQDARSRPGQAVRVAHSDMPMFSPEFYASLPSKHVAAGCVFLDEEGRVLLVKPAYKEAWELPGGGVEAGESPFDACRREVAEELGLNRSPQRLLGVDYRRAVAGVRGDALRFVFLGGVLTSADTSDIRLNADELSEWRFINLDELDDLVIPAMARRIRALLLEPDVAYLEEGFPVECG